MTKRLSAVSEIAVAGTIQLIGLICAFAVNILVARQLGVEVQGIFQLGFGWILILSTIGRLGLDQLTLRSVAENRGRNDAAGASKTVANILTISVLSLILVTVGGLIIIGFYKHTALGPNAVRILQPMMLAVVPLGLLFILTEALRGWQRYNLGSAMQLAGPWLTLLALMGSASLLGILQGDVLGWYIMAAYWLPLLVCILAWRLRRARTDRPNGQNRHYLPSRTAITKTLTKARPFYLNAIAFVLLAWVDVIILSAIATGKDIGVYTAVLRTGALIGNIVIAANVSLTPKIAIFFARGEIDEIDRILRKYMFLFIALVPVVLVVFVFGAGAIMSIWGAGFEDGVPLLQIYAVFQAQNLVFGIFGYVLLVTRREREMMKISLSLLLFKAVAVYLGYVLYGLWGAMLASGIALALLNAAAFSVYIRQKRALLQE